MFLTHSLTHSLTVNTQYKGKALYFSLLKQHKSPAPETAANSPASFQHAATLKQTTDERTHSHYITQIKTSAFKPFGLCI